MSTKVHALAALTLLLLAAGVMATGAASDTSSSDDGGGQVILLTTKQVRQGFVDNGDPGFSPDDQFVFSNDLYRNGEKVGEDGGTCTVTRIAAGGAATLHCLGTNSLPGGQISVQGLAAPGEPFELAITGGTGRYSKARGQVFGENTSPTEMRIKLVLR
jgi:hypothetical protein